MRYVERTELKDGVRPELRTKRVYGPPHNKGKLTPPTAARVERLKVVMTRLEPGRIYQRWELLEMMHEDPTLDMPCDSSINYIIKRTGLLSKVGPGEYTLPEKPFKESECIGSEEENRIGSEVAHHGI